MSRKSAGMPKKSVLNSEFADKNPQLAEELSNARASDISERKDITKKKIIRAALGKTIRYTAMLLCFAVFLGASAYVASYAIQYMEKKQQNY